MELFQIPPGADTVFFPGCTFPGNHPDTAGALLAHLRGHVPGLGLVLSCCFKTSHDLGRHEFFERRFGRLCAKLKASGVNTVLTACPNCFEVFRRYGDGLAVTTVYDVLAENPPSAGTALRGTAMVHTPCPFRGHDQIQERIRLMVADTGLEPLKTRQDGALSPCCGEGGAVGMLRPELSEAWGDKTAKKAAGNIVVTSCAGCVNFLSRRARTVHLLDLVFHPARAMAGSLPRPKGLATYLHRLLFKWRAMFTLR